MSTPWLTERHGYDPTLTVCFPPACTAETGAQKIEFPASAPRIDVSQTRFNASAFTYDSLPFEANSSESSFARPPHPPVSRFLYRSRRSRQLLRCSSGRSSEPVRSLAPFPCLPLSGSPGEDQHQLPVALRRFRLSRSGRLTPALLQVVQPSASSPVPASVKKLALLLSPDFLSLPGPL